MVYGKFYREAKGLKQFLPVFHNTATSPGYDERVIKTNASRRGREGGEEGKRTDNRIGSQGVKEFSEGE